MKNKKEVLEELKEKNQVPVGFTTHEAASILSVSFTTVITWIKKDKIKCYRTLGGHRRILPNEIERVSKLLSDRHEVVPPPVKTKTVTNPIAIKPVTKPVAKSKTPIPGKPIDKPKSKSPVKKSTSKPTKKVSVSKKPSKPINKI